jgi:hypothetical protein
MKLVVSLVFLVAFAYGHTAHIHEHNLDFIDSPEDILLSSHDMHSLP